MGGQRLGQNFLASAAWREQIVRAALELPAFVEAPPRGVWLEIGAGHGEMTTLLAPHVERLVSIEVDDQLLLALKEQTAPFANVTIVAGDVLALDLPALANSERYRIYGNLPYYITSPIVHRIFEHPEAIEAAFIVVQWEVAARLAAKPGTSDYGYFSAFAQFYSRPELLFRIPPGAFRPSPKVFSALVALRTPGERAQLGVRDERGFLNFLKGCFAQKRKTLRNNLRVFVDGARVEEILYAAAVPPNARAEELTLAQFAALFALAGPLSAPQASTA